jgi:hypothetical protein
VLGIGVRTQQHRQNQAGGGHEELSDIHINILLAKLYPF